MTPREQATGAAQPGAWTSLWRSAIAFHADKITPWLALRNSIGVTLPLAAGIAFHELPTGLAVAAGALNVAFSDSHDPYAVRARRMLAASVLVGAAVCAGALSGGNPPIAVGVAGAWAFAAGILVAVSGPASDLGVVSLVTLLVYSAVSHVPVQAAAAGSLAFAGGLLQAVLSLALWRLRRYAAQRRAVGELYVELAKMARAPIVATGAPPASAQTTQAQDSLAALDRDHSVDVERYRLLLSQAERMRLSLLVLLRIRARTGRDAPGSIALPVLDEYLEVSARMMESLGRSLSTSGPVTGAEQRLPSLQELALRLRSAAQPAIAAPMLSEGRFQMDAIAGQLRAAIDLASDATPAGEDAFARREARRPWVLRLAGTFATLRANLHFESAAFRHAVRLAVCVAIAGAIGRSFPLSRSYWLPMTVAIILKPDFSATFSRGVLRLLGTFAGLIFATGLVHVLPASATASVAAVAALMFALRCFGAANYGIFVTTVTALVVVLFALNGVAPKDVMAARAWNTAAGGAIALVAYALWPTWERKQVAESLARMLDAYREYFRAIRDAYLQPGADFAHELDRRRIAARRARSNLEASIARLRAEPGTQRETIRALSAILAASHRMVHAVMALEAGLSTSGPAPAREAFRTFANDVELMLYFLAAALRGSPLSAAELPDLREDHHALIHSGVASGGRHALVNVETDRIANSLNTVSEEVLAWLPPRRPGMTPRAAPPSPSSS